MSDDDTITAERVGILAKAAGIQIPEKDYASAAETLNGNRIGVLAKLDMIPQETAPAVLMEPRWGNRR